MKFYKLFCAILLAGSMLHCDAQVAPPDNNRVKVLSYNIRHAVGSDGRFMPERIAALIRDSGADIVALQEVDSATQRCGNRDILKEIADDLLMRPVFGGAIDFQGGRYGVGVLSRERPLSVSRIQLPGREEARVLLLVEYPRYYLGCTHLSLTPEDQLAAVDIIRATAARLNKPLILAGDLNTEPGSPTHRLLSDNFRIVTSPKSKTYPADNPEQTIDYIATYGTDAPVCVRSGVIADKLASDHRPVTATLQFKTDPDKILYHQPYLQNPTSTGITVMFQTTVPSHCRVEYGLDTLNLSSAEARMAGQAICHDIEHKVRLEGLEPGKRYYYRVWANEILDNRSYSKLFGDTVMTPFYSFDVPATDTRDFTILVLNDLHGYGSTIDAMSQLSRDIPHDMVIFNGDCLPEPADRAEAMRNLHRLADAFNGADTPLLFIRGNHEIRNAYSSGMPSLFDNPGGLTYGAMTIGDTRIVMLDCGEDKPDDTWVYYGLNDFTDLRREQAQWLKTELSSKPFKKAGRRILIHHIPVWGNTDDYQPCTEMWSPILSKAKFDIDLSAHTHQYRYHPVGELGNPCPVIVGGGPDKDSATMTVIRRKGNTLSADILSSKGDLLQHLDL